MYSRQWGSGRTDWEGIDAAAGQGHLAQTAFVGGGGATTLRTNQGTMYGAASLNETVCADGSYTGLSCGKVTATTGCALVDNMSVCGLEAVQSTDGHRIVQHGDSGGPVRSRTGSGGYGLISAGNVDNGQPGDFMLFATFRAACDASRECSPQ